MSNSRIWETELEEAWYGDRNTVTGYQFGPVAFPVYRSSYRRKVDVAHKRRGEGSKSSRYGVSPYLDVNVKVYGRSATLRSNYPFPESFKLLGDPTLVLKPTWGRIFDFGRGLRVEDAAMRQLAKEAFLKFSDQIPEETSIANFLIEIPDTGSLVSGLLSGLKSFSAKGLSGSYLAYAFGASPLYGDLVVLANLYSSIKKRIEFLEATRGKEIKLRHVGKDLVPLPVIRDWYPSEEIVLPGTGWEFYEFKHRSDAVLTARLTHNLEGLNTAGGLFRAFAAATGLNNPLGVAWNAVPFSFVLDWVGNVSSLFEQVKAQPFQGEWRIYDATWSIKSSTWFKLRQRDLQGGWLLSGDSGVLTVDVYRRGLGFPMGVLDFDLTQMSPKQLILSTALLRSIF